MTNQTLSKNLKTYDIGNIIPSINKKCLLNNTETIPVIELDDLISIASAGALFMYAL